MSKKKSFSHTTDRSLVSIGILFILVSVILVNLMPSSRMLPDLALILTIYCALSYDGELGLIMPIFAGAYIGSFSSFPFEYMGLYGMLYFAIRFISSFFQLRFVGYPIILAFFTEFFVGAIQAIEIYLKHPDIFDFHLILRLVLSQALLTALFLYPVFLIFDRFSRHLPFHFNHALK